MSSETWLYILEKGLPVRVLTIQRWTEWWRDRNRTLAKTLVHQRTVSTIFRAAIPPPDGDLELFETTILSADSLDGRVWRNATWEAAVRSHCDAVEICALQPALE